MITLLKIIPISILFFIGSVILYILDKFADLYNYADRKREKQNTINQIRQTNGCWNKEQRRVK